MYVTVCQDNVPEIQNKRFLKSLYELGILISNDCNCLPCPEKVGYVEKCQSNIKQVKDDVHQKTAKHSEWSQWRSLWLP